MAEISSLLTLQGQLALLTLIGFFLARKGIINAQGRKCLTDLLINIILPANIIQSFLVEFSWDVLKSSASILVISLALQIGCVVLCALGYNWLPFAKRSVYQYGTVCSNGAFLGSALVDGIWGSSGLLLSSIYLIPQRVAMWSVGVSYFLQDEKPASKEEMRADRRAVLRKTFTHPCILAVVVGMVLMAFGQRRKTAANAIASGLGMPKDAVTAAIEAAGFDARIRPEALTLEDFAKIQSTLAR